MNENNQLKAFMAFLFIFSLMMLSQAATAAVAVVPSVPGYSASAGTFSSASGSFTMTPANDGFIKPAITSVGGRSVTIPATLRMASNAGQVAKNAMRLNPWLLAGTLAIGWLADHDIAPDGAGGFTITVSPDCLGQTIGAAGGVYSNCYRHPDSDAWWNGQAPSPVCPSPYVTFDYSGFTPSYRYCGLIVPAGTSTRPATPEDFDALPDPLPAIAPELPFAPYMPEGVPVQVPEYSPSTITIGEPYTKADGSTAQPMAKVSPSGDGAITIDTYDQPLTDPQGQPVQNPVPQDTQEPAPSECQLHPETIGCAQFGTPPAPDSLTTLQVPVSPTVTPVGGAGSCPADITTSIYGLTWSYQPICDFASAIRPLIIGFAWLAFAYIVAGTVRT